VCGQNCLLRKKIFDPVVIAAFVAMPCCHTMSPGSIVAKEVKLKTDESDKGHSLKLQCRFCGEEYTFMTNSAKVGKRAEVDDDDDDDDIQLCPV